MHSHSAHGHQEVDLQLPARLLPAAGCAVGILPTLHARTSRHAHHALRLGGGCRARSRFVASHDALAIGGEA